jgi:hypothetical protein
VAGESALRLCNEARVVGLASRASGSPEANGSVLQGVPEQAKLLPPGSVRGLERPRMASCVVAASSRYAAAPSTGPVYTRPRPQRMRGWGELVSPGAGARRAASLHQPLPAAMGQVAPYGLAKGRRWGSRRQGGWGRLPWTTPTN